MKYTFTLLFCLFAIQLFSQDPRGIYSIEEVTMEGATKEEIYDQAMFWFAKKYLGDIDKFVSIDDREEGLIFATGQIDYGQYSHSDFSPTAGTINYSIKVEAKDGGYKVSYYNFVHFGNAAAMVTASYGLITPDDYCNTEKLKLTSKKQVYETCSHFHALIMEEIDLNIWSFDNEMRNLTPNSTASIEHPTNLAYSETIEFAGASREALFHACKVWLTKTYKTPKGVVQLENERIGELFLASEFQYKSYLPSNTGNTFGVVSYYFHIQLQDNFLSYSIYDFKHHADKPFGIILKTDNCLDGSVMAPSRRLENTCAEMREKIDNNVNSLLELLTQVLEEETGTIKTNNIKSKYLEYFGEVELGEITEKALFNKVNLWFASTFPNARNAFEIRDKKHGDFIINSTMYYQPPLLRGKIDSRGYITYHLRIEVEENKFKYTFDQFVHQASPPNGTDYNRIMNAERCYEPFSAFTDTDNSIVKNCKVLKQAIEENIKYLMDDLKVSIQSD